MLPVLLYIRRVQLKKVNVKVNTTPQVLNLKNRRKYILLHEMPDVALGILKKTLESSLSPLGCK